MFKQTSLTLQDYLRETSSDKVVLVLTIHDEINSIMNLKLIKPLLKKLITIGTGKKIMDNFGVRYLNFLYDVEYTKKGYFTGEGFQDVDDYTPYNQPANHIEHQAYKDFYTVIQSFNTQIEIKEINLKEFYRLKLDRKIKRFHTAEDDGFKLKLLDGTKVYMYEFNLKDTFNKYLKG